VAKEQTGVFLARVKANKRGCSMLNKNATDMGTSVAFAKSSDLA
jgi:hypothetical protein